MNYNNTYHMLHLSRRLYCSGKWLNLQHPNSCLMYYALTVNSVDDVLFFYLPSHLNRVLIMLVQAPHSPGVGKVCLRSVPAAILMSSTFQSLSAQISCVHERYTGLLDGVTYVCCERMQTRCMVN